MHLVHEKQLSVSWNATLRSVVDFHAANSNCIVCNGRMNDELGRIWKEIFAA
jgi:hypothetical protein